MTATVATTEPAEIPPFSVSRVPSSVQRQPVLQAQHSEPQLPVPPFQTTIQQTPTRGPTKQSRDFLTATRSNEIFITPLKPRRSLDSASNSPRHAYSHNGQSESSLLHRLGNTSQEPDIQETPLKSHANESKQNENVRYNPPTPAPPEATNPFTIKHGGPSFLPSSPPILDEAPSESIYEALGWDDYVDELA